MMIQTEKIVDLSQKILRRGENFPFHSDYIGNRHTGQWYVMSNIFIGSHVATHVECPRHHIKDGLDCLHYPLENLIGSCVTLDCTGKEVDDPITLEEVMRYKDLIHKGDIIFLWTGFDKYHRTERWTDYRYIAEDAMEWLVSFARSAHGRRGRLSGTRHRAPGRDPSGHEQNCRIESETVAGQRKFWLP